MGFLADIEPASIKSCLEINYYSAVFITQYVLKRWIKEPAVRHTRHIDSLPLQQYSWHFRGIFLIPHQKLPCELWPTHFDKNYYCMVDRISTKSIVRSLELSFQRDSWKSKATSRNYSSSLKALI